MRIITKKKENDILEKVAECLYIATFMVDDDEVSTKAIENLADISCVVGGLKGMDKVHELEREKFNSDLGE